MNLKVISMGFVLLGCSCSSIKILKPFQYSITRGYPYQKEENQYENKINVYKIIDQKLLSGYFLPHEHTQKIYKIENKFCISDCRQGETIDKLIEKKRFFYYESKGDSIIYYDSNNPHGLLSYSLNKNDTIITEFFPENLFGSEIPDFVGLKTLDFKVKKIKLIGKMFYYDETEIIMKGKKLNSYAFIFISDIDIENKQCKNEFLPYRILYLDKINYLPLKIEYVSYFGGGDIMRFIEYEVVKDCIVY